MKAITKTVRILSLVSLFTDTASEMLYPILPIYLKEVGFSILIIGILEGFAEAVSGLSKGYFGKLSDNSGKRIPFVRFGYLLSAISKPMLVLYIFPIWIFFARTIDRFGKGIRTGSRDAMLSDEATILTKGKVFGFHRAMDTIGAVLGPGFALIYLYYFPKDYKNLFYIAFIPGMLAVISTFFLKENSKRIKKTTPKTKLFSFLKYWKESSPNYRKLIFGLLIFTLFNSSDVFLLLKAKESGLNDSMVIGLYIFYNLVYALFAFPLGTIADKIGLKKMYILGLILFSLVYFGMALNINNLTIYAILFFFYGLYAAATEGISKAWISNVSDQKDTATAIGFYSGFQSIFTLIASSFAGFLWFNYNSSVTFISTGIVTSFVIFYFFFTTFNNYSQIETNK